jgi:hypothetical protein
MPSSSLLVTETAIGQTVTFRSKNPTDPTSYRGIVSGIITYALSGSFGFDSVSYNAAVQRADPTVGDITILNYFVITLENNQVGTANRLFADEWISPGTFSIIQNATVYKLDVYDLPQNGLNTLLGVLSAAGYNAVVSTS